MKRKGQCSAYYVLSTTSSYRTKARVSRIIVPLDPYIHVLKSNIHILKLPNVYFLYTPKYEINLPLDMKGLEEKRNELLGVVCYSMM